MTIANDFEALARGRRSIRRFEDRSVEKETLLRLIEIASWAPSAGNRQDWRFIVVTSPEVKERMAQAAHRRWQDIVMQNRTNPLSDEIESYIGTFNWFAGAPIVIAITAKEPGDSLRRILGERAADAAGAKASAAMAAQTLMLAAHAHGIGSCCLTGPLAASEEIKSLLAVRGRRDVVCLVALGYAAETPPPPPRKPTEEIVRFVE